MRDGMLIPVADLASAGDQIVDVRPTATASKQPVPGAKNWSVPRKNWTGNMSFSNRSEWFKTQLKNSGRGQADDSLPGSGAGSPRLCPSWKGGVS